MRVLSLIFMSALMASPALSQDEVTSSPLDGIYSCADIASSTDRLACFDEKVALVRTREKAREIVAIDAKTARELKKESFGFSLPSIPKLKLPKLGDGDALDSDEVRLPIAKVRSSGRDYVFEMENGQVWRQVGGRLNYVPRSKNGTPIEAIITSATMGSYKMKITNGKETVRGLRVRRVE